jgi:hypothetical protein
LLGTVVFEFELLALKFGRDLDVDDFEFVVNLVPLADRTSFGHLLPRPLTVGTDSLKLMGLSIHVPALNN